MKWLCILLVKIIAKNIRIISGTLILGSVTLISFSSADLLHIAGISQSHALGVNTSDQQQQQQDSNQQVDDQQQGHGKQGLSGNSHGSDILDATTHLLRLEKSNILLLGPTGSGEFDQRSYFIVQSLSQDLS